ncbi:MAG: 3-dehydroquinate synthase [Burkholderiales bacterium]|nr:3-dehydroquinate synthase [Burkholderiales bacterium]
MFTQINVTIPSKDSWSYPITIQNGLLDKISELIQPHAISKKIIIIADDITAKIYGEKILADLLANDYHVKLVKFKHGEENKSATTKLYLEEEMFAFGVDRHTLCIALGGGVVGDMVGFTAATYMRGIKFIQIPTTLLSMIDSSVGGKVAVNTSYGKNIIGAFWQPKAVIMDLNTLKTLPKEHIINGFFEAIKIFLTFDKEFTIFASEHLNAIIDLDTNYVLPIIKKAVELKSYVVEVDEFEQNLRMVLNFGHTVGHALEKITKYKLLHGYAIAYGMLVEAKIAHILGYLSNEDFTFVNDILNKLDVNSNYLSNFDNNEIIVAMRGDKKNINQQIKLTLLNKIGSVYNVDNKFAFAVDEAIIIKALDELKVV